MCNLVCAERIGTYEEYLHIESNEKRPNVQVIDFLLLLAFFT